MKQQLGAISQWTLGIFLSAVLLFPATLQLEHFFEGHDHKPCKDATTHLHEKNLDCTVDLFHFSHFSPDFQTFEFVNQSDILQTKVSSYSNFFAKSDKRFIKLRGPPLT